MYIITLSGKSLKLADQQETILIIANKSNLYTNNLIPQKWIKKIILRKKIQS